MLKGLAARVSFAAVLLFSAATHADETPAISGVFDGEPATWYLNLQNGEPSATFIERNETLEVDIIGFAEPHTMELRDSLALRLRLDGSRPTPTLESASLVYFIGNDTTGPVYRADTDALDITLENVEREGAWLTLEGQLESELGLKQTPQAAFEGEPVTLRAHFELRARRVEF